MPGKTLNLSAGGSSGNTLDLTVVSSASVSSGDMSKAVYDNNDNGIVDNSELVSGHAVESDVPAGAVFTDTVYDDTTIQAEVDANTAKVSNVDHPLVEEAVPAGSVFMNFKADYMNEDCVTANTMVSNDGWLMCANKDTCEAAVPQPIGQEFWSYDGDSPSSSVSAKQIIFGSRYTSIYHNWLYAYRIFTVSGNNYDIYTVKNPTSNRIIENIMSFTSTKDGWIQFTVANVFVQAGETFDVLAVVREPDPAPTTNTANYNYQTPNNPAVPAQGSIQHSNKESNVMSISYVDSDGGGMTGVVQGLTVGDVISDGNIDWAVQSNVDMGSYADIGVAPSLQGNEEIKEFSFEITTAVPITRMLDTDYWLTSPYQVQGLYNEDGGYDDIVPDNNAYGIDLLAQNSSVPEDWDVMAVSEPIGSSPAARYTYDYEKAGATLDVPDTYTSLGILTTPQRVPGVYEFGMSMTWDFNRTNNSAYFRFSTDGGSTWNEFVKEPKDSTDSNAEYYAFPVDITSESVLDLRVEGHKETGAGTLDVRFLDLWVERKA